MITSHPSMNLTTSESAEEEMMSCFNSTTNSDFTSAFVAFKKSVNVYFVGLVIVFGTVGNALSMVVLGRQDGQAEAKQRSSTNHLLRMLAIVDSLYLSTCFFIQTLKTIMENTEWLPDGPARRRYLRAEPLLWMFGSAAQTSTVWLVLPVTVDRYLAVCKPWKSRTRSSKYVASSVTALVLLALLYNVPRYFERVVVTRKLCADAKREGFNSTNYFSNKIGGSNFADKDLLKHEDLGYSRVTDKINFNKNDVSQPDLLREIYSDANPKSSFHSDIIIYSFGDYRNKTKLIESNTTKAEEDDIQYVSRTLRTDFRNNKLYFLLYKTVMYFVFRSFGPLILLLYFNWRLISDLRKVRKRRRDMLSRRTQHKENITVMLVVVVTVFIICQIPALVVRVAVTTMEFNHNIHLDLQILRYINELSNALLTLNSSVNFVIYCLVGKKFRKSFASMISCRAPGISDEATKGRKTKVRLEATEKGHRADCSRPGKKVVQSFLVDWRRGEVSVASCPADIVTIQSSTTVRD